MLYFILILLFGLAVAFFAGQNTLPVTVNLSNYQLPRVPLYVVIVGAMLIGFVVSWFVSLIDGLFNAFVLQGKDSALRNAEKKVTRLEEKNHELEVEIASLKGEHTEVITADREAQKQEEQHKFRPSFFGHFRQVT